MGREVHNVDGVFNVSLCPFNPVEQPTHMMQYNRTWTWDWVEGTLNIHVHVHVKAQVVCISGMKEYIPDIHTTCIDNL